MQPEVFPSTPNGRECTLFAKLKCAVITEDIGCQMPSNVV
jgi:hypothetical protein